MRIVMITDDVMMDRRIQLQCRVLAREGAEIYVLSLLGQDLITGRDLPEYEMIENFRVRRYTAPYNRNWLQIKLLKTRQRYVDRLNRMSVRGQERINTLHGADIEARDAAVADERYLVAKLINMRRKWRLGRWLSLRKRIERNARWSEQFVQWLDPLLARVLPANTFAEYLGKMAAYYDPDIVVAQDFPQLAPAMVAKKLSGAAVIYDAHEIYPEIGILTPEQQKNCRKVEARLIPQCDQVYTVNPYIAKEMAKRYRVPEPDVIYNMINTPEGFVTGHHDDRLRRALDLKPADRILLYQGWVHRSRGIPNMIRAMAQTPSDVHLVLLGYGDLDEALALAEEVGVADRVHRQPGVPWTELLHWTASADAGIIPYPNTDLNHYYCSPSKLFEYTIAGLPIIGNDVPFLRDHIVGNEFGLVGDLDPVEGYAAAINAMFDPAGANVARFKANMAANAYKFSYEAQEPKLLEIYERIPAFRAWRRERLAPKPSASPLPAGLQPHTGVAAVA